HSQSGQPPERNRIVIERVQTMELSIRSRHVMTPSGFRHLVVSVRDGRIVSLDEPSAIRAEVDLGERWLLPGFIDGHVHLNEPGHADWEGFETGTRAAIVGGITTLFDMPLNSVPVTTSVEALNAKRAAASGKLMADAGFHAG